MVGHRHKHRQQHIEDALSVARLVVWEMKESMKGFKDSYPTSKVGLEGNYNRGGNNVNPKSKVFPMFFKKAAILR